jgi:hypothetical protein
MSTLRSTITEILRDSLTQRDLEDLAARSWITAELAELAGLWRVDDAGGRELVGSKRREDHAGIVFPYTLPGEGRPCSHRLRRDNPPVDEQGKEKDKYLGAPGQGNRLYFPPGLTTEELQDPSIPLVLCEGEKKCLALWRSRAMRPRHCDLFPLV